MNKQVNNHDQNKGAQQVRHQQSAAEGKRPENKDNLDSRKNEEQDYKGSDITNNKKEVHGQPKKH